MPSDDHYDQTHIAFLEELWGEGFLSPGGPDEVARVLEGLDLSGKHVLDIGSGSGACAILLVKDHRAETVVGIDVEDPVCDAARKRVARAGLEGLIAIRKVAPGPFPFDDATFDVVFSKDSIIHIPDKVALAAESFRVLKPGGYFAASDWLIEGDDGPSAQMADYIAHEGLGFEMASPKVYFDALTEAGFEKVSLINRNPWYKALAKTELGWLTGPDRPRLKERYGEAFIDHQVVSWTKMVAVLDTGEHCPYHIRARKPV